MAQIITAADGDCFVFRPFFAHQQCGEGIGECFIGSVFLVFYKSISLRAVT
jgi:hypothetical protein